MIADVTRSVTVDIGGQSFTVQTDASEKYVRELAALVGERMAEARAGGGAVTTHALALLTAMRIADDLREAEQREADLRRRVAQRSKRILEYLDRVE